MTNHFPIFARPVPTTPDLSVDEVYARLRRYHELLHIRRAGRDDAASAGYCSPQDLDAFFDTFETDFPAGSGDPDIPELDILRKRATQFVTARIAAVQAITDGLRMEDRGAVKKAIGHAKAVGVVDLTRMHEIIAELHARAPWMAPAAAVIQRAMERATIAGPAPFHTPPLILLGKPGIGKSAWARDLARAFSLPVIDVDVGATQGATFAISGTERGWSSAAPGRVVSTILATQVVNPLIIIDELDKLPANVASTRGSLPGAAEALKSMIEPTTAKSWTCPYYRVPVNLSRVSWLMTTNSLAGLPAALLDRCKVVTIGDPSPADLHAAALRMLAGRIADPHLRVALADTIAAQVIRRRRLGHRTSLRQIARAVARIEDMPDRVWDM
ncbi:AAA family ATPase [Paracoccus yeei]|uniref:AAA family ATPase n=1 Tax=Paracoccus yeei TaxID=147645 RepID=UPI0037CDD188